MTGYRFIHTADWQLGMSRRFLAPEAQARFAQDRIDAIRRIGALAREQGAQFVVVCGDVFESNQVDRQTIVRALDALATIQVPVLLLPGNHDPLDAASVYQRRAFLEKRPPHVLVVETAGAIEIPGVPGCEVVAAPWESKRPLTDLTGQVCAGLTPAPGRRRILVGHGMVDSLSPDRDDPALISLEGVEEAIERECVAYVALGDRHSATQVSARHPVWYSGSPVATDFGEARSGYVLRVEIPAAGPPQVTELPVGAWIFAEERFELYQTADVESLSSWLDRFDDKARTIVRLILRGTLSLADKSRLDEVLAGGVEHFAALNIWERHADLAVIPDELDLAQMDLSGYARAAWEELERQAAQAGEEGGHAAAALALFYRLQQGGGR